MNDVIKEIEKYAKQENVPIMQKRGINFLCKLITLETKETTFARLALIYVLSCKTT